MPRIVADIELTRRPARCIPDAAVPDHATEVFGDGDLARSRDGRTWAIRGEISIASALPR